MFSKRWIFISILFLLSLLLVACGGSDTIEFSDALPQFVQRAPHDVKVAYQFAIDHPDMLTHQPCYCGCNNMGHVNNLECFVRDIDEVGNIAFDSHASGCRICVDIALDVKRLTEEGMSQLDIRHYIDATYSASGPSTDTPMPEA